MFAEGSDFVLVVCWFVNFFFFGFWLFLLFFQKLRVT